jgi:lipopolysaccharide cholinephosphotransferase
MREISLKDMQRIELDLLMEFNTVCKRFNLRYFIDGGTLLGAVCYDGFIPWDDDIDIKMPRPDYEKLLTLQREFPEHIFLDAPRPEHCEYTFLKLIDRRTVLKEENGNVTKTTGVYIDVLPMDGHPDNSDNLQKHLAELSRLNSLFHASQTGFSAQKSASSWKAKAKGLVYSAIYSPWKLYQKLTRTAKRYPYDKAQQVGLLVEGDPIRERFEKAWLEPSVEMLFEGHRFPAPNAAEEHLSIFYRKPISRELYYQKLPRIESEHRQRIYWKEESV